VVGSVFEVPRSILAALFCAGFLTVSAVAVIEVPMQASALPSHSPIVINGDAEFTAANGVTQGDGSETNPYVIEGWAIEASASPGIEIRDTTAYFVIRGVSVTSDNWQGNCILVSNSANALIRGATVSNAGSGVRIEGCDGAVVKGITAKFCINGVQLLWCDSCILLENNFQSNDRGVEIYWSTNAMLFSNTFDNCGVSIIGDLWQDETYNSHIIPSNNTVNGLPILCYRFQDGLTLKSLDAGQLILLSCSNVRISGMAMSRGFQGITAALCEGVEITDCSFVDCIAVLCLSCTNVSVSYNTCDGSSLNFAQCRNLLVHGNVINNMYYMGIQLHNCWVVTASSNTIVGADLGYGIFTTSDDVTITGNTLTRCGIDGSFRAGNNLRISPDNTVNGKPVLFYQNTDDVVVDSVPVGQLLIGSCDRVWVANVSISETSGGIIAEDFTELTIFNTDLSNNERGLSVLDGTDVILAYNRFTGNVYDGAMIQHTTDCTVYGNTFKDNENGMRLWMSEGVKVWRNIFSRNTYQASEDGCTNVDWDGGYPEGGNYWSDYSGTDQFSGPSQDLPGSDGFGDTPYSIGANSQDRYPFMSPPNVTIPQPPPAGINATLDFEPDTLNIKRMGMWVTVYIELPSGYDVKDIVIESVVLNGRFPATGPYEINDYDHDKVQELMVKFDWRKVLRLDGVTIMETMTMTVSGLLKDGTAFQGSCDVTIATSHAEGTARTCTTDGIGTASVVTGAATTLTALFAVMFMRSRRGPA